jgi:hypothetical protein
VGELNIVVDKFASVTGSVFKLHGVERTSDDERDSPLNYEQLKVMFIRELSLKVRRTS